MTPLPLDIPPGIVKTTTPNAAKGRFTDCDHIRFVSARPEKWKGWRRLIDDIVLGKARGAVGWSNQFGNPNAAFGTHLKLYALLGNDTLQDITPARETGTLGTDPFSVTEDSATVEVTDVDHLAVEGDFVIFDGASAVGGITIDGEYQITLVLDEDTYTIEHTEAATSTATGGGAAVDYEYQINTGLPDAVAGLGWSAGGWSEGTWSTPRAEGLPLDLRVWSLSEYGNDLLANPSGGGLYFWQEATDARAEVVANAPTAIRAMFLTGERYVLALGCLDVSPMTVKWPDRDDFTDWTPSAANTANERTLQSGSKLMGGTPITDGISLVWSDTSVYLFQYTGDEFVYSDRLVGREGCGLGAPKAFATMGGVAYWFTGRQLMMYAGGGAVPIPNAGDVLDFMLEDMDPAQLAKVWAEPDLYNTQVRFHYCSKGSEEPDRYVDVNAPGASGTSDWAWTAGTWPDEPRTTGCIFRPADAASILVGASGALYSHNDGLDADEEALDWLLTWGFYKIAEGASNVDVMGIIPDCERQIGPVDYRVFTKDRPNDAGIFDEQTISAGPTDGIVDTRVCGRHFSMTASQTGVRGGDIRFGIVNLEFQDAGERR